MSKESRIALAKECMKYLNIYKPYITRLGSSGPCFYEACIGYWARQEEKLQNKVSELEKEDKTVFAIIHSKFCDIGDVWDFLTVDDNAQSVDDVITPGYENNSVGIMSYCYDDDMELIDIGDIGVISCFGGVKRVW